MTQDYEYICNYYGVPAAYGRRVTCSGKPGVIVGSHGAHIAVVLDQDKPNHTRSYHPTDKIKYHGFGRVRKMTASQKRYQEYLQADWFSGSFGEWLGIKKWYRSSTGTWSECRFGDHVFSCKAISEDSARRNYAIAISPPTEAKQ